MRVRAWSLPEGCPVRFATRIETVRRGGTAVEVEWPIVAPEHVAQTASWLRAQREHVLARRTVAEIARSLDRTAMLWLDPSYSPRKLAIDAIAVLSGYAPEMVAHAIELEQASSRAPDLLGALDQELGDHRALDRFVPSHYGRHRAVGPALVGGIFSANIPALPHLTVLRSFLVKAGCLGRISRHEPVFLPLYAESLREVDPELASCLAVLSWDAADSACEAAFLQGIDHLIAYGGDRALAALRSRCPPGLAATWHGHRMGFAYVSREALETDTLATLADAIAYDVSAFDQHACLAPQACFVERGGAVTPDAFANAVAHAMASWRERLPPRTLSADDAASLRMAHQPWALRELMDDGVRFVTSPDVMQATVITDTRVSLEPTPNDRFARLIPVDDLDAVLAALRPVRHWLQCAAVTHRSDEVIERLAQLGVTRLCPPGHMATPSMRWHHDGHACLSRLVHWCDEETRRPG